MPTTQISAHIPDELKARLDRFVRAHGVTRAHLIEQALQHHLQALEELPPEAIIPTRIVLTPRSARRVRELVEHPPKPTRAMKALFSDRRDPRAPDGRRPAVLPERR
ncbi:MAG: ribbon-helix-helix protein, CopG family [Deltaproteobacteria bacterium]|nr:ribbon-helix-helix protein, CopG family [Deltaproteobacteria bacterium]